MTFRYFFSSFEILFIDYQGRIWVKNNMKKDFYFAKNQIENSKNPIRNLLLSRYIRLFLSRFKGMEVDWEMSTECTLQSGSKWEKRVQNTLNTIWVVACFRIVEKLYTRNKRSEKMPANVLYEKSNK